MVTVAHSTSSISGFVIAHNWTSPKDLAQASHSAHPPILCSSLILEEWFSNFNSIRINCRASQTACWAPPAETGVRGSREGPENLHKCPAVLALLILRPHFEERSSKASSPTMRHIGTLNPLPSPFLHYFTLSLLPSHLPLVITTLVQMSVTPLTHGITSYKTPLQLDPDPCRFWNCRLSLWRHSHPLACWSQYVCRQGFPTFPNWPVLEFSNLFCYVQSAIKPI